MIKNTIDKVSSRAKRQLGVLAVAICMAFSMVPVHAEEPMVPSVFASGNGTRGNPYQVATVEQLEAVRNDLDACYVQVADIDLEGIDWIPIGEYTYYDGSGYIGETMPFTGVYDGGNYSIENLTISSAKKAYVGLFGFSQGIIRNLNVRDAIINIKDTNKLFEVGGICGYASSVYNCSATGQINLESLHAPYIGVFTGGIAGRTDGAYYCNSDVKICIENGYDDLNCGGIAGIGNAIGCVNKADIIVKGNSFIAAGGIIGDGDAFDCINYGDITAEGNDCFAGGITGAGFELLNCVNYGNVSSSMIVVNGFEGYGDAGGITGRLDDPYDEYTSYISNCYNIGSSIHGSSDAYRITPSYFNMVGEKSKDLYSLDTTLINGEIASDDIGTVQRNGESTTREKLDEMIAPILNATKWNENHLSWNGHEYHVFPVYERNWQEAAKMCDSLGGYLATISSQEENDALFGYITSLGYENVYFGFTDAEEERNWKWVNEEPVTYTNWHSGEPNGENSNEDYAQFYWKFTDGTWNDGDFMVANSNSGTNLGFLCEWGEYETELEPIREPSLEFEYSYPRCLMYEKYELYAYYSGPDSRDFSFTCSDPSAFNDVSINYQDKSNGVVAITIGFTTAKAGDYEVTLGNNVVSKTVKLYIEGDRDGDGLLDEWEVNGIDYVHDGMTEHLDLPAMGADPWIPDIFIEVDYMYREGSGLFKQGKKDYRMPKEVYNIVYQAFKEKGIKLHIDAGKDSIMNFDTKETWGDLSRSNGLEYVNEIELGWQFENWLPYIESSFDPIRHAVFRHCSLIGKYTCTHPSDSTLDIRGSSGISYGGPSQMFMVAIDSTEKGNVAKAGTFMHELGHTLGLSHGGLESPFWPEQPPTKDQQRYKPNHLSIMNYRYQFSGLRNEKGETIVNYQDFSLPSIVEYAIDERRGIIPSSECKNKGLMVNYNDRFYRCTDPIDFNKNGIIDEKLVEFDLNPEDHYPSREPVTNRLTETLNEWDYLEYKAGSIGGNGAAILTAEDLELHVDPNAEAQDELTIEEALRAGVLGTQDECKILTDELSPLYSDMVNQKLFVAVENLYHADTVVGITVSSDMLENAFYEEVELGASVSSIAMKTLSLGVKDNLSPGTYTINFSLKLKNGEVIEQSAEVTVAKPEVKTIKVGFEEDLNGDAIEWQTSDPAVLRIEDTKLMALTEGNAYLYGIDSSGLYESVYVILVEADSSDPAACPVFGFCTINGKKYWFEDGVRQGVYGDPKNVRDVQYGRIERGREIYDLETDAWFWLDAVYDGAVAASKEVWVPYIYRDEEKWDDAEISMNADNADAGLEDYIYRCMKEGTGKWVRYDENGAMLKGWVEIKGELAKLYPDQNGNIYYYDHFTGLMVKGWLTIDGELHHFDETTGVMIE